MRKILLVEDDESLGFVTKDSLENKGFEVHLSTDGMAALEVFKAGTFDICLLDVMLPKLDGYSLAKEIRDSNQLIPIIFLTAKGLQEDKLHGFKLGADDYITKPFSMDELVFRIEVFLKRVNLSDSSVEQTLFQIGSYSFDYDSFSLERNGTKKKLTRREADILCHLASKPSTLVKREEILMAIWGDDDYFKGRSLDVFISKLRKYLNEDDRIEIENYHGVGFKLRVTS